MLRKNKLPINIALLLLAVLLAPGSITLAQDPTGRPTKSPKTPPKTPPKNSTKTPPKSNTPPPIQVTLTVLSDPAESVVYINGVRQGATNEEGKVQFEKLAMGQYMVEVRKTGFQSASRVFNAGIESPTLVFKLKPDIEEPLKQVEALIAAGNLNETDSLNALQLYKDLSVKYPNRPELERLRGMLVSKFTESIKPTIDKSVKQWRQVTREELARAADSAAKANELKSDDTRLQAELGYLRGAVTLRDGQAGGTANSLAAAKTEFEKAVAADSGFAPAYYQLGVVALLSNDAAGAEAAFLKATQMEPGWTVAHVGLGLAYSETKKYNESVEAFRKAQALDANNVAALAGLGLARAMKGETKEGLRDLDRAKQLDAASGLPYLNTGIYFASSKKSTDWKRAEQELATAIQKNAGNQEFLNSRAEQLLADLQARKKK